jgi:hypothetical protein
LSSLSASRAGIGILVGAFPSVLLTILVAILVTTASCNLPGPSGNAVTLQNGAVRIVDQAGLAGKTPCSEGRGGLDRWCVFFKQKQSATRGQDVWAVNVSRIGRGENVQCNQSSSACVELALGDHVVHWGFVADTLVIDGVPPGTAATARVSAPVTAWRPGWESAVAVTANPVSGCWVDVSTESVACVELGAGGLDASATDFSQIDAGTTDSPNADASAIDAGATAVGTFYAGRLTQSRRALTIVPQGREEVQALASSDSLLVFLSPGGARLHLDTGIVDVLPTQITSQFGVTPDESWFLWFVSQKTNITGARSLVAAPFPAGGTRHVLLGDVLRHHLADGPRSAGADVVAIAGASDGTTHLMVAGPDPAGAALWSDLGLWTGTTTDRLDAISGGGYAVVSDTQGTALLSLLEPGPPCFLTTSTLPPAQVLTVPSFDSVYWVNDTSGAAGTGYASTLSACSVPEIFATSAMSLELDANRYLLYIDSGKHLMRLDVSAPAATPVSMRDADEVVYRWAYVQVEDLLLLDMTSVFDTAERLYVLRHPFPPN